MRYLLISLVVLLAACQPRESRSDEESMKSSSTDTVEYGGWSSPVTAESIVQGSRGLSTLAVDKGYVYWVESRPLEGGRSTIMRKKEGQSDTAAEELLAAPWNVRTRVHEYGGRSMLVSNGVVWFTHFTDQRIYRMVIGEAPVAITPEDKIRFGACELDANRDRLICIREDHRSVGEPQNTLVAVPANGMSEGEVLFEGPSFVSAPSLSLDGKSIAFIAWNHPNMPWDGTELYVAERHSDGTLGEIQHVAGGLNESVLQPEWSPDGEWIVEPVRREETLMLADLGPALIRAQRQNFDPAGH